MLLQICCRKGCTDKIRENIIRKIPHKLIVGRVDNFGIPAIGLADICNTLCNKVTMGIETGLHN